jgi:hypothetical protein
MSDCKSGFERSAKTRRCIKKCSSGSTRNAASGRCKKDKKPCPPGSSRNPSTGRCKKDGRASRPASARKKKLPKMEDFDEYDIEDYNSGLIDDDDVIEFIPEEAAFMYAEKGLIWDEDGKYLGKVKGNKFIKP